MILKTLPFHAVSICPVFSLAISGVVTRLIANCLSPIVAPKVLVPRIHVPSTNFSVSNDPVFAYVNTVELTTVTLIPVPLYVASSMSISTTEPVSKPCGRAQTA